MNAEDIWADFDAIVDLDSVCKSTLVSRVELVNRVASACCMQVISALSEIQRCDDDELRQELDNQYDIWRDIHSKLLKL